MKLQKARFLGMKQNLYWLHRFGSAIFQCRKITRIQTVN